MAYSKNRRALILFCAVSKDQENFLSDFSDFSIRTNVTFIRNKFMIFMFCAIVFLDNFLVQLVVINMGVWHTWINIVKH